MQLISVDNLGKSIGGKRLFDGLSFGIEEGRKIALIGINGCGKSTLLRLLTGIEGDYEGTIARNRELRISVLSQIPVFDPEATILEYILSGDSPRAILLRNYESCLLEMERGDSPALQNRLADLLHRMESEGAWDYESRFASLVGELDIADLSRKMGELSGGMVRKVDLARALVEDAHLLFLDEPTNHLDIKTIVWLQQYLQRTKLALVLVTHDRYFLDSVCTEVLELEDSTLYRYEGNYSFYMEKKAERESEAVREQAKIKNVLRRELAWLRRGAKARSTKQKARIQRAEDLGSRIEKDGPKSASFEVGYRRLGKTILELDSASKGYDGREVVAPFSRIFKRGERLGLVGPNGSGKSTLLGMMTGGVVPDSGEIKPGVNTLFGLFDQTSGGMDPETRVLDFLKQEAENIRLKNGKVLSAAQLLESFLFPKQMFQEEIGKLSGGERRRLQLIRVLLPDPNFLIFDEPTNDLDIQTLSLLEEFLLEFPGCVAVVSHDRYFLDRVVDTVLVFDGKGGIREYPGNYSQYLESQQDDAAKKVKSDKMPKTKKASVPEKKKLSYMEQKEFDGLLDELEALEQKKAGVEAVLSGGETDPGKINEAAKTHAELEEQIALKTARWEELAERAG